MKKIISTLLFALITFYSCAQNKDIVGSWKYEKTIVDVETNFPSLTEAIIAGLEDEPEPDWYKNSFFQFNEDKKGSDRKGNIFKYSELNDSLIIDYTACKFSIKNDELIFFVDKLSEIKKSIANLSKSNLNFYKIRNAESIRITKAYKLLYYKRYEGLIPTGETAPDAPSWEESAEVTNEYNEIVAENEFEDEQPFTSVEEMPYFKGGDKAMKKFITDNLQYPLSAKEEGIEGRVYLRFVIQEDGKLSKIQVVKGVNPAIDREAVRLVKSMPDWEFGKQNNRAVAVYFSLPIEFRLPNSN